MTMNQQLTFHPRSVSEQGIDLVGEVSLAALEIDEDDRLAAAEPAKFAIHVAQVSSGILAQGKIEMAMRCRCDRCLKYFDLPVTVADVCHFLKNTDVDAIDLTDEVREDILLSFPQHVLCRTDCLGLCANCGQNLNVRDCGCRLDTGPENIWGRLDELTPRMEAETEDDKPD